MSSAGRRSFAHLGAWLLVSSFGNNAQQRVPTPRVSVSCSVAKPGTAAATIVWQTARAPVGNSRLDVTVYQSGFSRGWFAFFRPLGARPLGIVRAQDRLLPQMNDSSPSRDRLLPVYRLSAVRLVSSPETAAFTVDGLEDGITYYWRLAVSQERGFLPGSATRIDAPTCAGRSRGGRG